MRYLFLTSTWSNRFPPFSFGQEDEGAMAALNLQAGMVYGFKVVKIIMIYDDYGFYMVCIYHKSE